MNKIYLFLTALVLSVASAMAEEIDIQQAYKGNLPIDSVVVISDEQVVLQKLMYQYDAELSVIGVQIFNYDEYGDSLYLATNSRFEHVGDTIIERFMEYNEESDTTFCRCYHAYCKDGHGNITYDAIFTFHEYMGDSGMWTSESIKHMEYDELNRITLLRKDIFDYSNGSGYIPEFKTYYAYPSENVSTETTWRYDSWEENFYKEERIEYRIAGDSTLRTRFEPDYMSDSLDAWVPKEQEVEVRHTPDSITTYTAYADTEWGEEEITFLGWKYDSRDRIVTGNRKKTIYTDHYEDNEWHIAYMEVFYYDAGGRTTARYYYYWDSENNYLHPGWKYEFHYYSDGTKKTYDYYWDDETNDWKLRGYAPARSVVSEEYSWDATYRIETTTDDDGTVLQQRAFTYNELTELWDIPAYTRSYTYYYNGTAILSGIATDIEPIVGPASPARKMMQNGQILILRDGNAYNIQGVRVEE